MKPEEFGERLSQIPLIDNHCHFFSFNNQTPDLSGVLNLSRHSIPRDQLTHTMVYQLMITSLARYLNLGTAVENQVLAAREKRMTQDYPGWVKELFQDARIAALIIDQGYMPAAQPTALFESVSPCPAYYLFRMETALDPLWESFSRNKIDFHTAEKRYFAALEEGLSQDRIVGLKSIIGYRTGLDIRPESRSLLIKSGATEKQFRDFFFCQTLDRLAREPLPVQIHASFGESHIDIRNNHPGMLKYIFDQNRFRDLPLVLVHAGYPRSFEAGFLASVYPNVYVDLSEMIPFAPLNARQGIVDVMNMCPVNKIMYGSDGFVIPEIHWLGARVMRRAMARILSDLVLEGLYDADGALDIARMMFYGNAYSLYQLDRIEPIPEVAP